jgi:hypothetical protein
MDTEVRCNEKRQRELSLPHDFSSKSHQLVDDASSAALYRDSLRKFQAVVFQHWNMEGSSRHLRSDKALPEVITPTCSCGNRLTAPCTQASASQRKPAEPPSDPPS